MAPAGGIVFAEFSIALPGDIKGAAVFGDGIFEV